MTAPVGSTTIPVIELRNDCDQTAATDKHTQRAHVLEIFISHPSSKKLRRHGRLSCEAGPRRFWPVDTSQTSAQNTLLICSIPLPTTKSKFTPFVASELRIL